MVMAVATLVEKAFLIDQGGADETHSKLADRRGRFAHLSDPPPAGAREPQMIDAA